MKLSGLCRSSRVRTAFVVLAPYGPSLGALSGSVTGLDPAEALRIGASHMALCAGIVEPRPILGYKGRSRFLQLLDDVVVISATDFNNYLACEHLTTLDLKALRGELERPSERPGQAELLAKLGDEHEQNYLRLLLDEDRQVTTIERGSGFHVIRRAAAETEAAFARASELASKSVDFSERFAAAVGQWRVVLIRGELRPAHEVASKLLREAEAAGRVIETGIGRVTRAISCYYSGNFAEARTHGERGLDAWTQRAIRKRWNAMATTPARWRCAASP